jgi:hypothetical protein
VSAFSFIADEEPEEPVAPSKVAVAAPPAKKKVPRMTRPGQGELLAKPSSTPASASGTPPTTTTEAASVQAQVLARAMREGKCFECGASFPDWCSLSLLCLLCLSCAGKHRSLGVHISFVQSLSLDAIPADALQGLLTDRPASALEAVIDRSLPLQTRYISEKVDQHRARVKQGWDLGGGEGGGGEVAKS